LPNIWESSLPARALVARPRRSDAVSYVSRALPLMFSILSGMLTQVIKQTKAGAEQDAKNF
jgi:hypothetical protein